jgi:hypothetical protein
MKIGDVVNLIDGSGVRRALVLFMSGEVVTVIAVSPHAGDVGHFGRLTEVSANVPRTGSSDHTPGKPSWSEIPQLKAS